MCAIQAGEAEVTRALEGILGVSIAAVNGPAAVVVSGDEQAVEEVAAGFAAAGRRTRRLRVSHAFHSHRMDPVLGDLGRVAAGLAHRVPRIPWAGALGGELVTAPGPGYWAAAARRPVRFADAVRVLAAQGVSVFIEIGPDGTLSALGQDILGPVGAAPAAAGVPAAAAVGAGPGAGGRDDGAVFIPLLRSAGAGLAGLAAIHVAGVGVGWAAVLGAGRRVGLPTYAFRHQRYWLAGGRGDPAGVGQLASGHPLLGAAVALAGGGGLVLTGRLSVAGQPWLGGHVIAGRVLVPGAALAEMAVRAADEAGSWEVGELVMEVPLVLPARGGVQVQVTVEAPRSEGGRAVAVHARAEGGGAEGAWTRHAAGVLVPARDPGAGRGPGLTTAGHAGTPAAPDAGWAGREAGEMAAWPPGGAVAEDLEGFYARLAGAGRLTGRTFRGLRAAWRRGQETFAEVALPPAPPPPGSRSTPHSWTPPCTRSRSATTPTMG